MASTINTNVALIVMCEMETDDLYMGPPAKSEPLLIHRVVALENGKQSGKHIQVP